MEEIKTVIGWYLKLKDTNLDYQNEAHGLAEVPNYTGSPLYSQNIKKLLDSLFLHSNEEHIMNTIAEMKGKLNIEYKRYSFIQQLEFQKEIKQVLTKYLS